MKQALTLLLSLSFLSSFSQIGTFKKVETNELRLRTMLNSDITKFLTTNASGKVVLATVSGGGGSAVRFGIEDNTSTVSRSFSAGQNDFIIDSVGYMQLGSAYNTDANNFGFSNLYSYKDGAGFAAVATIAGVDKRAVVDLAPGTFLVQTLIAGAGSSISIDATRVFLGGPKLTVSTANEYADNAAAISGGLSVGDVYRTADLLKIVH